MKFLKSHIVPDLESSAAKPLLNSCIEIVAVGEPGPGGAHNDYKLSVLPPGRPPVAASFLHFQLGGIENADSVNGVSQESLLAVVEDRLAAFQAGPSPDEYNADALFHVQAALAALHGRTKARSLLGILGTQTPTPAGIPDGHADAPKAETPAAPVAAEVPVAPSEIPAEVPVVPAAAVGETIPLGT